MAVIQYIASGPRSNGTRPYWLSVDGNPLRVDARIPQGVNRTTPGVSGWVTANVSAVDQAAWSAKAAQRVADGMVVDIPDRWHRAQFREQDVTRQWRALIREMVSQINVVRTDPNTVKAAITSTDILTGMRADINSTA